MTFYLFLLNGYIYVSCFKHGILRSAADIEDAYDLFQFEIDEMVDTGYIPVETQVQVIELFGINPKQ